ALNLLAQDGYIQKVRGKGSVIIDVNKFDFPVSGIVSFKELTGKLNLKANTILHELAIIEADQELTSKLKIRLHEPIWKVCRVREMSGEKVILDKDYLEKKLVKALTKEKCEDSIYDNLENEMELNNSFARKEVTVEDPTREARQVM